MRILIVGAITGGTVPIGRAVYSAFLEIKQQAEFLDFSDFRSEFNQVKTSRDREQVHRFLEKCQVRLTQKVEKFTPDAILAIAQSPLVDKQVLSNLRQAGIRLIYWFVEDYRIFDYWKNFARFYDHFFTIQKYPFWDRLQEIGCQNFHYLPTGFDENLDYPVKSIESDINVSFMGAPYLNRVYYFSKLNRSDFHIYGQDWDVLDFPSIVIGDRRISETEARDIYRRTHININLHSSQKAHEFGQNDFVNPRTFELAGLGVFQLTDRTSLLPLHFNTKSEVPVFKRWEELERAIDYYLKHEKERKKITTNAKARVAKEHTYRHRVMEILRVIKL